MVGIKNDRTDREKTNGFVRNSTLSIIVELTVRTVRVAPYNHSWSFSGNLLFFVVIIHYSSCDFKLFPLTS